MRTVTQMLVWEGESLPEIQEWVNNVFEHDRSVKVKHQTMLTTDRPEEGIRFHVVLMVTRMVAG